MAITPRDVARDILAKSSPSYDGGPIYVSAADTARLIRATLKVKFPGVKFSVKSDTFSGGSSVRVSYDGIDRYDDDPRYGPGNYGVPKIAVYRPGMPNVRDVKDVVDTFGGASFDGMIDMAFSHDAYLMPDGRVFYGGTRGTGGSHGSVPGVDVPKPAGAVRASFHSYLSVDAYGR